MFNVYSINFGYFKRRLELVINQLKLKSKTLFIYSFITLLSIVLDKILIKSFFGSIELGYYSLSFLAYSMFLIFGGSLISGSFNLLTNCRSNDYCIVLKKSILWTSLLIIIIQLIILTFINNSILKTYIKSIPYMYYFLPSVIFSLINQISYIYFISKEKLQSINNYYLIITIIFLVFGLSLSYYTNSSVYFAFSFLIYQFIFSFIIFKKFSFIQKIIKKTLLDSKKIIILFIFFQLLFISYSYNLY